MTGAFFEETKEQSVVKSAIISKGAAWTKTSMDANSTAGLMMICQRELPRSPARRFEGAL